MLNLQSIQPNWRRVIHYNCLIVLYIIILVLRLNEVDNNGWRKFRIMLTILFCFLYVGVFCLN